MWEAATSHVAEVAEQLRAIIRVCPPSGAPPRRLHIAALHGTLARGLTSPSCAERPRVRDSPVRAFPALGEVMSVHGDLDAGGTVHGAAPAEVRCKLAE